MTTFPKHFVDTNIFVYLWFDVEQAKQERCKVLFEQAEAGMVHLWTTEWVVAELVWFLTKQHFAWAKIKGVITKVLTTSGLEVRGKQWLLMVLELVRKPQDFVDVVNVTLARSEGVESAYSYDKGLDNFGFIKRKEP